MWTELRGEKMKGFEKKNTLEYIMKINWFDILLLKSLGEERKTTKEIMELTKKRMIVFAPQKTASRVLFTQRLDFLWELGIINKDKGIVNLYEVKPGMRLPVQNLCAGLMGIHDELNRKRGDEYDGKRFD